MTQVQTHQTQTGVMDAVDRIPRTRLGHTPTPLEHAPRLAGRLGLKSLLIKRDDCTGLAFGGNKVRQLEFYLGEAMRQNADTVLITGAVQSNFVRLAAAGARTRGMDCHIQLERRVPGQTPDYHNSGNVLLDRLLGATLHSCPDGEDEEGADRHLGEIADGLRNEGKRPYIIPLAPGHKPLGALGYVVGANETLNQLDAMSEQPDEVFIASGSGHTHGGFLFGLRGLGSSIPVKGVCVRRSADRQIPRVRKRVHEIADVLGIPCPVGGGDIDITDETLAPGYGMISDAVRQAISLAAECEGLLLDPVYTAKVMAAVAARARNGGAGKSILFVHTGGTPALFGYLGKLTGA